MFPSRKNFSPLSSSLPSVDSIHLRMLQLNILIVWSNKTLSLDHLMCLSTKFALDWCLCSPALGSGKFFHPMMWKVLRTVARLLGLGGVLDCLSVHRMWSPEESLMLINVLEFRAVTLQIWVLPVQVQSNDGGLHKPSRSHAKFQEEELI